MKYAIALLSLCLAGLLATNALAQTPSWQTKSSFRVGVQSTEQADTVFTNLDTKLSAKFSPRHRLLIEARAFFASDDIQLEPEDGGVESKSYLELRQIAWQANHIGFTGVNTSVGKARLREHTGLWWDRNLTHASIGINRSLISSYLAITQELNSFRTDNSDNRQLDKNVRRWLHQTQWQWKHQQYVTLSTLFQLDNNQTVPSELNGQTFYRHADAHWIGGIFHGQGTLYNHSLQYTFGVTQQSGDVVSYLASNPSAPNLTQKIDGKLIHGDIAWEFNTPLSGTLGFQFFNANAASANKAGFFQSRIHSNNARLTQTGQYLPRLTDAYRPELSNMAAYGIFLGLQVSSSITFDALLNQFERVNDQSAIGTSAYSHNRYAEVSLADTKQYLGLGTDIILSYQPNAKIKFIQRQRVRLRFSHFNPGNAYTNAPDLTKATLDWRVAF